MGLFDDKKYESMDEISKMVEPWETPFDSIIEKLPDEYELPPLLILRNLNAYEVETSFIKSLLNKTLTTEEVEIVLSNGLIEKEYKNNKYIPGLFDVKISEDFSFNSATKEVTGSIKLVKTMKAIPEAKLKEKIINQANKVLFSKRSADNYKAESMRIVYEVITGKPYQSNDRSKKSLIHDVKEELKSFIAEDRWRIRSFALYIKLIYWFENFCSLGSSASIANIMKMKIMTYNGRAIYSIGEEK
jgi:hypothetical protein